MRRVFSVTSVTNGKEFHSVSATMKPCTLTYCCWLSRISPAHLTPSPPVQLDSPLSPKRSALSYSGPFSPPRFLSPRTTGHTCSVLPRSPLSPWREGECTHIHTQSLHQGKDFVFPLNPYEFNNAYFIIFGAWSYA